MAYITTWSYGLQIVFKFQEWRKQTSGFNWRAWWFDHKPLVFTHQSWHLNTFSKSRAHVLFRLWIHLCIIHKKHCDWWKWLHTQPQTFWSHSSNTNKNNNIRFIRTLYKSQLVTNLSCIDLCSSLGANVVEAGQALIGLCAKSNVDARRRVCCACNVVLHRVNYLLVALDRRGIIRRNSIKMSKIARFYFLYHKNLLSTIPVKYEGGELCSWWLSMSPGACGSHPGQRLHQLWYTSCGPIIWN